MTVQRQKQNAPQKAKKVWDPSGVLPGHPAPKEDEMLSSWMLRLAAANHMRAHRLANIVLGKAGESAFTSYDVDRSASPSLVRKLSEKTGRPAREVLRLSLRGRYDGRLYVGHCETGYQRWVLPGGLRGVRRPLHGLLYCPLCFQDDPEPYFRARWRLSLSCVCTRHDVRLLDRCPGCGRPPEPHRANLGVHDQKNYEQRPLSYCSECDTDLCEAEAPPVERPLLAKFQQMLLSHISRGYVEVPGYGHVPSPLWFDGLYQLARLIGFCKRGEKLRIKLESLTDTGEENRAEGKALAADPTSGKRKFEALSLPWRRHVMHLLAYLMNDWPDRFLEVASGRTLTQSVALDGLHYRSIFWYEDFCKRHLWSWPRSPTEEEVLNAQRHLIEKNAPHGPGATSRTVGLNGRSLRVKRILEKHGRWPSRAKERAA